MSLVEFQELRQSLRATLQMGAFDYRSSVVRGNEGAFEISTARISQDLLAVLGTDPTRGRHFVDREFLPSSEPVALISTALWNRLFPESIFQTGQQLIVNDVQHQIVGIMHPTFRLPLDNPATEVSQVWTPLRISENRLQRRAAKDLDGVIARLAPGRTMAQAQAALDTRIDSLVSTLRTEYQEGWKGPSDRAKRASDSRGPRSNATPDWSSTAHPAGVLGQRHRTSCIQRRIPNPGTTSEIRVGSEPLAPHRDAGW